MRLCNFLINWVAWFLFRHSSIFRTSESFNTAKHLLTLSILCNPDNQQQDPEVLIYHRFPLLFAAIPGSHPDQTLFTQQNPILNNASLSVFSLSAFKTFLKHSIALS